MKCMRRTVRPIVCSIMIGLMIAPAPVLAQEADAPGQPGDAAAQNMQVIVTATRGKLAQIRKAQDQPWQPVRVGMALEPGAEFRTGPGAAVQFRIGDDQLVTLDRLGTVKVLEAVRDGQKARTNVGMKYGRTRYDIQTSGVDHESKLTSPTTTLAIRGTGATVRDEPGYVTEVFGGDGDLRMLNQFNEMMRIGTRNRNAGATIADRSTARRARVESVSDPGKRAARTKTETTVVEDIPGQGGDDLREFLALRQSRREESSIGVAPTIASLVLLMGFFGGDAGFTNVDMIITDPNGHVLGGKDGNVEIPIPGQPNFPAEIDGVDMVADAMGEGMETAVWPTDVPEGRFDIHIESRTGDTAIVTLAVPLACTTPPGGIFCNGPLNVTDAKGAPVAIIQGTVAEGIPLVTEINVAKP